MSVDSSLTCWHIEVLNACHFYTLRLALEGTSADSVLCVNKRGILELVACHPSPVGTFGMLSLDIDEFVCR